MPKSVIWKFEVETSFDGFFEFPLPADARVLLFDYDGRGQLCAWAEIPDATKTKMLPKRRFRAVATGQEFEPEGKYVSTVFQRSELPIFPTLVFHIYELAS